MMAARKGRLEGKTALVTAAAQGIGKATVIMFAQEGCNVIATDINVEKLQELKGISGVQIRKLDVCNKEEIATLAKDFPKVDVLFNCVGYVHQGTILDCSDEVWEKSFKLNVTSMFHMCQAFLPNMEKLGHGSIINMSSVCSSVKGLVRRFAYGTTKAAIVGLSRSLASDFVDKGIRVNTICPGTVDTPSFRDRVADNPDPEKAYQDFINRQKMKRIGQPNEIAALVVYLASDESSYTTGTEFVVDGGIAI